jgi:hypothetical protein
MRVPSHWGGRKGGRRYLEGASGRVVVSKRPDRMLAWVRAARREQPASSQKRRMCYGVHVYEFEGQDVHPTR